MTSRAGRASIARVAADANVVLSALTGGAALAVFTQSATEVVTADSVLDEVREYLPVLGERYGIAAEALEAQFALLALRLVRRAEYKGQLREAERRIARRDPDDVNLLAVALKLRVPVWSNDKDFEVARVPWYTTAQLLTALGIGKPLAGR